MNTFDASNQYVYQHSNRSSLSSTNSYDHRPSISSQYGQNNKWEYNNMGDDNQKRSPKRGISTFITKLHSMVSDRRNHHLISWNPSGTSFLVCNATRFAQEVLPEHFKHSNFSSFVRQLNMYGFHKINKSPRGQRGTNENEIWEFSHPKFQSERTDLLEDIRRKAMDSELLRRETGDIHASFAMVQLSQADLLQQFRVLQDNFANLLQGFDEMKKVQFQQQTIIKKLAERQGLSFAPPLNEFEQTNIFVPSSQNNDQWSVPQPQHKPSAGMMIPSIYHNGASAGHNFPMQMMGNTLPPSPDSSVLLPSPSSSCTEDNSDQNLNTNNIGFPQRC